MSDPQHDPGTPPEGMPPDPALAQLLAAATTHLVVPAMIILMVGAFLFFLIDLRSAFLPGAEALKWIGSCFVVATVLIARYGRMYGDVTRQGAYLSALFWATFLAITSFSNSAGAVTGSYSPWLSGTVNILGMWATFRLANGITRRLSIDEDMADLSGEEGPPGPVIETMLDKPLIPVPAAVTAARQDVVRRLAPVLIWLSGGKPDPHGNPAVSIARLSVVALLLFAGSEPTLLLAAPEVGRQALLDVMAYCFGAGVLLAVGSATGTLRHVRRRGGLAGAFVLPARGLLGAVLLLFALSAVLAVPGVQYQGSGRLRQRLARKARAEPDARQRQGERRDEMGDQGDQGEDGHDRQGGQQGQGQAGAGGGDVLSSLTALGKGLVWPLGLALAVVILLGVYRARGLLGSLLSGWLRRLGRRWRSPGPGSEGLLGDPFADLSVLSSKSADEAVRAAYGRFLLAAAQLGRPRAKGTTPLQYLRRLPPELRLVSKQAEVLTDLYMQAAYTRSGVGAPQRDQALQALRAMEGPLGPMLRRARQQASVA